MEEEKKPECFPWFLLQSANDVPIYHGKCELTDGEARESGVTHGTMCFPFHGNDPNSCSMCLRGPGMGLVMYLHFFFF